MVAPIACRPLTCWSTGRWPIAQPPGSETFARPQRASSGPSTSTEARMVFTSSYGAVGSFTSAARSTMAPSAGRSTATPICERSLAIVETSISRGTLPSASGWSVSSAAHMIGRAEFFAPETRTSPSSGRPPAIRSLSTGAPLQRGQGAHRERVDLHAHSFAQRRVHQLMALHAALAFKRTRDDQRLEMLPLADHLDMRAGEARLDAALDAFRRDQRGGLLLPSAVAGAGEQGLHAVEPRDGLQALGQVGEDELAAAAFRLAQPDEQSGEQRRVHLGDLAEVHRAHAFAQVLPALLEHAADVGERHRPAHQHAPAFAANHFVRSAAPGSSARFFACRSLINPSTPFSRTTLLNSVR